MTLITPNRLELANSHLAAFLSGRTEVRLDEARVAVMVADRDTGGGLTGKITPTLVSRLLRARKFAVANPEPRHDPLYRLQLETKREAGIRAARRWRWLNKPYFDGLYGEQSARTRRGAA